MGGADDERGADGAESKRDRYESEAGPLRDRKDADTGPVRGANEADTGPNKGRDETVFGPEEDRLGDVDDEEEEDEEDEDGDYTSILDLLVERAEGETGRRAAGPIRGEAAEQQDGRTRPKRARRRERVGGPRRRVRRWGEAARQAAIDEIALGGRARRSLRAAREAAAMSQRDLADLSRLSRATISEVEQGRRRPHPRTMRVLAQVLGVKVGEIAWP